MTKTGKIIYLFITLLFFIILNIYLTDLIINNGYKMSANDFLEITYVRNQGAAFNIFEGYRVFLITFSLFAITGIITYVIKHIKIISTIGLFFVSILMSGIFVNMLDRITYGYVRDFIKLNFIDFPVFNLSDIFINLGVIAIVFVILKNNYFKK